MFVKLKFKIIFFLITCSVTAQVGIDTPNPTATLDVNGNLRVRDIVEETNVAVKTLVAQDSVLVTSNEVIKSIPSKDIIESVLLTAVKGGFVNSTSSSINLATTYTDIPFDSESFDLNSEYDTTTHTFTAKQNGIYQINVQVNAAASISASTNYGVCILKNGTIVAQENFSNVTVNVVFPEMDLIVVTIPETLLLNLPVTPPARKTETLVQLNVGDTITFQMFSDLGAIVNLSDNIIDSYFTIVQIR